MKIKLSIYKTKRFSDAIDQVLNLERVKRPVEFEMEDARAYLYVKEYMDPNLLNGPPFLWAKILA